MYSLKNILTQSPEKVKVTILSVIGVVLALATDIDPSLLETVGLGIAIERVLDLLYVAPIRNVQNERIALQGIALGRQMQPVVQAEHADVDVTVEEGATVSTGEQPKKKR